MSRAIFNRMLLAVHGQGDELATPDKRKSFHCSGCLQGCDLCDTEASNDIEPDASRTFKGRYSPRYGSSGFATTNADRARWAFKIIAAAAVMAALIQSFPQ